MLMNTRTGETIAKRVVLCDTFWLKFKGLMFRRALDPSEAFVFVYPRESIAEMTIHMFFVFFPIAVLWLDSKRRVVDKTIAKPFRPFYAPKQAAQYFVEGVPALLERVKIGDTLTFSGDK
ncbi:MAG: DUF192 domain-containing protein [Anaerolineae bacterium]|nr:DUF192 domain-containing protein [Anaerolineae bacterium]